MEGERWEMRRDEEREIKTRKKIILILFFNSINLLHSAYNTHKTLWHCESKQEKKKFINKKKKKYKIVDFLRKKKKKLKIIKKNYKRKKKKKEKKFIKIKKK